MGSVGQALGPISRLSPTGYTVRLRNTGRSSLAIFGKQEPPPVAPHPVAAPSAPTAPTILGAQSRFVGEIFGDEDFLINGRFEGKVQIERNVTIGVTGDVLGDLLAKSIVVAGKVEGQVMARERAELLATATVKGTVQAPKVVIAEGAQLQGNVGMSSGPPPSGDAPETTS
ncbi:MAG TPA: polymer-forming cytoskeletal protein [Thermoanaerobaculia bacterium]|nr:polymer-forming cytoskeletal protein [Thermoanaerobaculia bacterium]